MAKTVRIATINGYLREGLTRRYRQGLATVSVDTGGSPSYFEYDGLGSVVNLTSSSGVTQWTYAYLPYGGVRTETKNQNQAPANVLRFSGGVLDPTGLYQLRARSYDPGTGRFISTDPAAAGPTDPYVSAYAYANGNPIRWVDPSGRCLGDGEWSDLVRAAVTDRLAQQDLNPSPG